MKMLDEEGAFSLHESAYHQSQHCPPPSDREVRNSLLDKDVLLNEPSSYKCPRSAIISTILTEFSQLQRLIFFLKMWKKKNQKNTSFYGYREREIELLSLHAFLPCGQKEQRFSVNAAWKSTIHWDRFSQQTTGKYHLYTSVPLVLIYIPRCPWLIMWYFPR